MKNIRRTIEKLARTGAACAQLLMFPKFCAQMGHEGGWSGNVGSALAFKTVETSFRSGGVASDGAAVETRTRESAMKTIVKMSALIRSKIVKTIVEKMIR